MSIPLLTSDQHAEVLRRLISISEQISGVKYHEAGVEYTSLLSCFLLHNLSAAQSLLSLLDAYGWEWFPSTVGYPIARTMLEVDIAAHYIKSSPRERSEQYVLWGSVLDKRAMDACAKHRASNDPTWNEAMNTLWREHWESRRSIVEEKYSGVKERFARRTKKNTIVGFKNWAGISLRQMAIEVDHEEVYDLFYADMCSFAHADIRLADRFLRRNDSGLYWSQRAHEGDAANVFRYADTFLTCYLKLFSSELSVLDEQAIASCWTFDRP